MKDRTPAPLTLTDVSATRTGRTSPAGSSCGCCSPQDSGGATGTATGPHEGGDGAPVHYEVAGLTCGSCVGRVRTAISGLDGVTDVRISLVPDGLSTVSVISNGSLDQASIRDAVERAGYQLTSA